MINTITQISWLSVLVAYVGYFLLGPLWYMFLFPKAYKRSLGLDPLSPPSKDPIYIVGLAICSLVITLATAIVFASLKVQTPAEALQLALIIGIGFLFANTVNIAINPNIPKPLFYGIISGGFHVVGILIVTLILYAFQ